MKPSFATRALVAAVGLSIAPPAHAWDAATTHVGLTERALAASTLPRRMATLFGIEQGLYQVLRLDEGEAKTGDLLGRLGRLDAASGLLPAGGKLTAMGWLLAGSVLEEVPAGRRRAHFFNPSTGLGLRESGPVAGIAPNVEAVGTGGESVRAFLGGDGFDASGMASTAWLTAKHNELGLGRFLDARERALTATTPAARESALAVALLSAGALLHVIEDAAVPAYVENDYRVDLYREGAPLLEWARLRYGRVALPAPSGEALPVRHLAELIHDAEGGGLADRTATAAYSLGALAAAAEAPNLPAARAGRPALVAGADANGYLFDGRHHAVARWERSAPGPLGTIGTVRWTLDRRCYADQAASLLPEAARSALSAIEHLFRDPLVVEGSEVRNGDLALGAGTVTLLAEDAAGKRSVLRRDSVASVPLHGKLLELPPASGAERLIVVYRGVDEAG